MKFLYGEPKKGLRTDRVKGALLLMHTGFT